MRKKEEMKIANEDSVPLLGQQSNVHKFVAFAVLIKKSVFLKFFPSIESHIHVKVLEAKLLH